MQSLWPARSLPPASEARCIEWHMSWCVNRWRARCNHAIEGHVFSRHWPIFVDSVLVGDAPLQPNLVLRALHGDVLCETHFHLCPTLICKTHRSGVTHWHFGTITFSRCDTNSAGGSATGSQRSALTSLILIDTFVPLPPPSQEVCHDGRHDIQPHTTNAERTDQSHTQAFSSRLHG